MTEPVPLTARAQELWQRHERWLQPLLFLGGAYWDYATLRIHRWTDQLLMVAYLGALVTAWIVEMRHLRGRPIPAFLTRRVWVAEVASSFFLGAMLSALGIAVLRASYPGPTALFLALLLGMAIANEAGVPALRGDFARYTLATFFTFQLVSLLGPFVTGTLLGYGPAWGAGVLVCVVMVWLVDGPEVARATRDRPGPGDRPRALRCGTPVIPADREGIVDL